MLKISWGYKISLLYLGFMALIFTLVVKSMNIKTDLVANDYYSQEIRYQEKINAANNAKQLNVSLSFLIEDDSIQLFFPLVDSTNAFVGSILFFRPSDNTKDVDIKIHLDKTGIQKVSTRSFLKGLYKMQISWSDGTKQYFVEEVVVLK